MKLVKCRYKGGVTEMFALVFGEVIKPLDLVNLLKEAGIKNVQVIHNYTANKDQIIATHYDDFYIQDLRKNTAITIADEDKWAFYPDCYTLKKFQEIFVTISVEKEIS